MGPGEVPFTEIENVRGGAGLVPSGKERLSVEYHKES